MFENLTKAKYPSKILYIEIKQHFENYKQLIFIFLRINQCIYNFCYYYETLI